MTGLAIAVFLVVAIGASLYLFLNRWWDWKTHLFMCVIMFASAILLYTSTIIEPRGYTCTINYTVNTVTCSEKYGINPVSYTPLAVCLTLAFAHLILAVIMYITSATTYIIEEATT